MLTAKFAFQITFFKINHEHFKKTIYGHLPFPIYYIKLFDFNSTTEYKHLFYPECPNISTIINVNIVIFISCCTASSKYRNLKSAYY